MGSETSLLQHLNESIGDGHARKSLLQQVSKVPPTKAAFQLLNMCSFSSCIPPFHDEYEAVNDHPSVLLATGPS